MPLTESQIRAIITMERVGSVFSLCGAAYIIATFLISDKFRKPINRLIFYASFGNILSNVASLVSISGIRAGLDSPLCQFQGFLIQCFMPADALWAFAMAFNVYLSFFHSYTTAQLRRLEPLYVVGCYGIPFIPAFTFLFVNTSAQGKIYGSGAIWCWIDMRWETLRLATLYGPVWLVIISVIAIYARVGAVIYKWRKHLVDLDQITRNNVSAMNVTPTQIVKTQEFSIEYSGEDNNPQGPKHNKCQSGSGKKNTLGYKSSVGHSHKGSAKGHFNRSAGLDPNKAALKYTKCALLFFVALIITWVPSTANRISTFVHPGEANFGLNFATALVLPLQGLWNSLIYTATSSDGVHSLIDHGATFFNKSKNAMSLSAFWPRQARQKADEVNDRPKRRIVHVTHDHSSSQVGLIESYV